MAESDDWLSVGKIVGVQGLWGNRVLQGLSVGKIVGVQG